MPTFVAPRTICAVALSFPDTAVSELSGAIPHNASAALLQAAGFLV